MRTIAAFQLSMAAGALLFASGCSRETTTGVAPADQAVVPETSATPTLGPTNDVTPNSAATGAPGAAQTGAASATQEAGETMSRSSQFVGYPVTDQQSQPIGEVEAVWEEPAGEPAFIGVKRPDQDALVVIPAEVVQANQSRRTVRLNLSSQVLESAPTLAAEAELDDQVQAKVANYFHQQANTSNGQPTASSSSTDQAQDQATIRLREEQATVGKRTVQSGGVVLRKVVRTETNREPVTLRREELVVERIPGGGQVTNANFAERDVYIPLRREVPVVDKDTVLKETVRVGKEVQQQQTNVVTPVRQEELRIQQRQQGQGGAGEGNVSTGSGAGASSSSPPAGQQQQASPQQR